MNGSAVETAPAGEAGVAMPRGETGAEGDRDPSASGEASECHGRAEIKKVVGGPGFGPGASPGVQLRLQCRGKGQLGPCPTASFVTFLVTSPSGSSRGIGSIVLLAPDAWR